MGDEKRLTEEKRYAILPKETIKTYAEAIGISDLPDDVASVLAEDVVYRLREATQNSSQFMRHAKRRRMTADDFNKALRVSDIPVIYGHGSPDSLVWRQTREGELTFPEDIDINLANVALSSHLPQPPGHTSIKAHWLAVEGVQKSANLSQAAQGKSNGKGTKVSDILLEYYDNVTKAILGTDQQLIKFALADLKTNANISPLLPYLVNFIANGVKTVSHDISQLTKLLQTVRAIFSNHSIYLEPRPYLQLLIQGIEYCLLEPLAASINPSNDHWALRDSAARLLAQVTREWSSSVNQLLQQTLHALLEVLRDHSKPFCCHYGAIMGIAAFGHQEVEEILLPELPGYWSHLQPVLEEPMSPIKADAYKVYGAVLLAGEQVIHRRGQAVLKEQCERLPLAVSGGKGEAVKSEAGSEQPSQPVVANSGQASTSHIQVEGVRVKEEPGTQTESLPQLSHSGCMADLYTWLADIYGDSLSVRLPVHSVADYYSPKKEETFICLDDEHTKKSGEELLETFLNARHESHSNTPTEEVENNADEKSERSSRSYRSHSDESVGSFDDHTDLTIKTTVGDPSKGIKLTILKRPKTKDSAGYIHVEDDMEAAHLSKRQRLNSLGAGARTRVNPLDVFEPIEPSAANAEFVFSYAGCIQRSERQRRQWQLHQRYMADMPVDSDAYRIGLVLKPYGRRHAQRPSRPGARIHIHTADITNSL